MDNESDYYKYLKTRSNLGLFYRMRWLYPRLDRLLNGKTLDIGCGIGDFLSFRKNTFGVDINIDMVEWCNSNGYEAKLMENNILPFNDSSYDSVIMDNVLEHIEDPAVLLKEVKRILVDDGVFLVGVPGSYGYSLDSDHKVFYSSSSLIRTLNIFGFKNKQIFNMPMNIKFLEKFLKQYCIYGVFENQKESENFS
jgi:SAM-dependent methyltransferase